MPCKAATGTVWSEEVTELPGKSDRKMTQKSDADIRETHAADLPRIEALYDLAFPDEELMPLVRQLLGGENDVLSLVALDGDRLVGHVAFTICRIEGADGAIAMLAPLAVAPAYQRRGIGSALVDEAFRRLRSGGILRVQVLGDPAYYGRFGFAPDDRVTTPYPLPAEWRTAWQYIDLSDGAGEDEVMSGRLSVPPVWQEEALWLQ
ncbi:MAG: GNAT family N-acetyltransferase [Alphaproteobacteria bacterium]